MVADMEVVMLGLLSKILDLLLYYRKDKQAGKPYWLDPTFVGLAISILGIVLARWTGIELDSDLQLKIVGVVTGIGALVSPHTGLIEKKAPATQTKQALKSEEEDQSLPLETGSN
jgi:hypothetical protein